MELDSRQRQHLKGLAHHLKPVVHIGKDGLTPALLAQVENALLAHELVKVRLGESAPLDRKQTAEELPAKTGAAFVQNVGKVFVLYRPHPEEPRIEIPPPRHQEEEGEGEGDLAEAGLPQSVRRRGPASGAAQPSAAFHDRPRTTRRGGAPRRKKTGPRSGSERKQHGRGRNRPR